jgi:hypothetical protein
MTSPRGLLVAEDVESLRTALASISNGLRAGSLPSFAPAPHLSALGALCDVLEDMPRSSWPRLATSFNEDQVESKLWLLHSLPEATSLGARRIVVLGAWYGLLAMMLEWLMPQRPLSVCCIDIDEDTCATARRVVSVLPSPPAVRCADMLAIDYQALRGEGQTIFVNTSCEHLTDFDAWRARIPGGTRLVLQSNNHTGCPEHVSCVPDLEAFERQARLAQIDFRGVLALKHFNRFMLIGHA